MSYDSPLQIAQSNLWGAIYPELTLGLLALGLLLLEIALPKALHRLIPRLAILGQMALLGWIVFRDLSGPEIDGAFGGMLAFSPLGQAFRVFFLLASIFICYIAMVSLERRGAPQVEFFHILLVATGALMLLAQASHFLMLFVALEAATVGFFVLVSYFRTSPLSLEAGLKYLVTAALSSGLLLFGIALLFGAAGNPALEGSSATPLAFASLRAFLEANPGDLMARLGMILVVSGVAFKVGAFPFQIWIPDVYQGAPLPTAALLAIASKAAGFAMLINLMPVFAPMGETLMPLLSALAALTILFGNFAALTQRNLKRVIGLSGVSHAGFLLVGVVAMPAADLAVGAIVFYLFAYLLASVAVFAVLVHLPEEDDAKLSLDDLGDLARRNGFLGLALAVGIGSLAGIPPLAGFIGKLMIFLAAYQAGLTGLLFVSILGVVVSIYYYFGVIKAAFFEVWRFDDEEEEGKKAEPPLPGRLLRWPGRLAILAAVAGSALLGVFHGPLGDWIARL